MLIDIIHGQHSFVSFLHSIGIIISFFYAIATSILKLVVNLARGLTNVNRLIKQQVIYDNHIDVQTMNLHGIEVFTHAIAMRRFRKRCLEGYSCLLMGLRA